MISMKAIDAHQHLYAQADALPKLVAACRANGIVKVCLSACGEQYEHPDNAAVRKAIQKYPDLIVGFGRVYLDRDQPAAVNRLRACGFRGIKVIAPRRSYNDKSYFPLYARASQLRMPVLFHTGVVHRFPRDGFYGTDSSNMRPVYLDGIARRFPDLRLIGAHLGACWIDEACAVAEANPNVYFDLSGVVTLLAPKPRDYFDSLLFWDRARHKFVFGLDATDDLIPMVMRCYRTLMAKLRWPSALRRAVYHDNMARILKEDYVN